MDVLENAVIEKNALVEAEAFPTDDRVTYRDSTYEIVSKDVYKRQASSLSGRKRKYSLNSEARSTRGTASCL